MYSIVFLPDAEKLYKKLFFSDRSRFQRVAAAMESLRSDPFQGKPLKHHLKGFYSLRVGVYRIIYMIERQKITVYIFDIGHRREIYQGE